MVSLMLFLRSSLNNSDIIGRLMEINEHVWCITQHRGDSLEKNSCPPPMCQVCHMLYRVRMLVGTFPVLTELPARGAAAFFNKINGRFFTLIPFGGMRLITIKIFLKKNKPGMLNFCSFQIQSPKVRPF